MGKLIDFSQRGRPLKPRPPVAASGEVVIFTGVRYQRDGGPAPARPVGASGGTKRRRG